MRTAPRKNKKKFIVALLLALILLLALGALVYAKSWWPFQDSIARHQEIIRQKDIADPTYNSEKTNPADDETEDSATPENSDTDTKTDVQVGVASASKQGENLEVRAFVIGAIEGDGVCTAVLTKGTLTVSETSIAFIDTSTSQCEPIEIAQDRLSPGTWSLVVTYESNIHQGSSTVMKVDI